VVLVDVTLNIRRDLPMKNVPRVTGVQCQYVKRGR